MIIRKVYQDFIRQKLQKKDLNWFLKRGRQYLLTHLAITMNRPLCGPVLASLVVTYKCNYHCRMCDVPLREKRLLQQGLKELSTRRLKTIINEFAAVGVAGIGFTGGEPLLRQDIFALLAHAKSLGIITHLNTNGFFLDRKNIANLFLSGVDSLNISLDGAYAETHDSMRGYQGAFQKIIPSIERIVDLKQKTHSSLRIKLVAVLNRKNIDEVFDLIQLSVRLGTDCVEFIPQQSFFSLKHASDKTDDHFRKKLATTVEQLIMLKKEGMPIENSFRHLKLFLPSFRGEPCPIPCYAAYNSCAVDCYGEFYPCLPWLNWGKPVGNIRDRPLRKFWYSPTYNRMRKNIVTCRNCYLNCQTELNLLFNRQTVRIHHMNGSQKNAEA